MHPTSKGKQGSGQDSEKLMPVFAPGGAAGRRKNEAVASAEIYRCMHRSAAPSLPTSPSARAPRLKFHGTFTPPLSLNSISCGWLKRIQPSRGGGVTPPPPTKGVLILTPVVLLWDFLHERRQHMPLGQHGTTSGRAPSSPAAYSPPPSSQ